MQPQGAELDGVESGEHPGKPRQGWRTLFSILWHSRTSLSFSRLRVLAVNVKVYYVAVLPFYIRWHNMSSSIAHAQICQWLLGRYIDSCTEIIRNGRIIIWKTLSVSCSLYYQIVSRASVRCGLGETQMVTWHFVRRLLRLGTTLGSSLVLLAVHFSCAQEKKQQRSPAALSDLSMSLSCCVVVLSLGAHGGAVPSHIMPYSSATISQTYAWERAVWSGDHHCLKRCHCAVVTVVDHSQKIS